MIITKFAVWDKEKKEILHFSNPEFCDEYNSILFEVEEENRKEYFGALQMEYYTNPTLMQYININDKHGEEIYSDYLMKDEKGRIFRIYAVPGGYAIKAEYWMLDTKDLTGTDELILMPLADPQTKSWLEQNCEIIGNIYAHENTEITKL